MQGVQLSNAGLGPKSCRNVCATLRRMLVYAAKLGFISSVPEFPDIKVPKATKFDWFNREEIETLLAPVTDPRERAELLVGFDCGLRAGEQVALVWGDVNFHPSAAYPNGSVSISKASSRGVVYLTKSGEPRTVPLTNRCAAALRAIRGLRHLKADALIFPAPEDAAQPDDARDPDRRLERACARAGLRRIRRHGARHSFASNMVSLGVPLLQVSQWLGHSEVTITARVYAHLAPTDGARWLAAYEATPVKVTEPAANRATK